MSYKGLAWYRRRVERLEAENARLREEMHEARVTLAGLAEREYAAKLAHDRLGNALKETT